MNKRDFAIHSFNYHNTKRLINNSFNIRKQPLDEAVQVCTARKLLSADVFSDTDNKLFYRLLRQGMIFCLFLISFFSKPERKLSNGFGIS